MVELYIGVFVISEWSEFVRVSFVHGNGKLTLKRNSLYSSSFCYSIVSIYRTMLLRLSQRVICVIFKERLQLGGTEGDFIFILREPPINQVFSILEPVLMCPK